MDLVTIGINHKSAPLAIREQAVVGDPQAKIIITDLLNNEACQEVALLSTCNRTELYCKASAPSKIIRRLHKLDLIEVNILKNYSYALRNQEVVAHMYRVASGLDSMVLGEAEIFGQLKSAYRVAKQVGGIGKYLNRLFESAFLAGKIIRSQTRVGANPISIAYIAVRLAKTIFADLSCQQVLVIGAGNTAELIIKHLLASGVRKFLLANRTKNKSEILYKKMLQDKDCSCEIIDLEALTAKIHVADLILSSTASPLPIIGKGTIERALGLRKNRPIFIIDVAVPRDVEPEVNELDDVYLYCLDDLQSIARKNHQSRQEAILDAESIIESQVSNFLNWLEADASTQALVEFRGKFEDIRDNLLQQAVTQMQQGKDPKLVLANMAYGLTNKFLHTPTVKIKQAALNKDDNYINFVKALFNL